MRQFAQVPLINKLTSGDETEDAIFKFLAEENVMSVDLKSYLNAGKAGKLWNQPKGQFL